MTGPRLAESHDQGVIAVTIAPIESAVSARGPVPVTNVRDLAAYLRRNGLPGQRRADEIIALRRERQAWREWAARDARRSAASAEDRLRRLLVERAYAEIDRRGGETEIVGENRAHYLRLVDRNPRSRMYLVKAEGWRYYSKAEGSHFARLAYLCGMDDNGPWAVRVPGTMESVAAALDWLTPAEVKRALAAGKRVLRQGDVYAVETVARFDGAGAQWLDTHHWNPVTRYLLHRPADGRRHRPLRVSFPVRFVQQRAYGMERGAGRADAD